MAIPTLTPTSQTSAIILPSTGTVDDVAAACPIGVYTGEDFLSGAAKQVDYTFRKLGGDVLAQLFENMSPITEYTITQNIKRALENSEPRAIVEDINTTALEDQNALRVSIKFSVRNIPEPIEVDVLLERIR